MSHDKRDRRTSGDVLQFLLMCLYVTLMSIILVTLTYWGLLDPWGCS